MYSIVESTAGLHPGFRGGAYRRGLTSSNILKPVRSSELRFELPTELRYVIYLDAG